MKKTIFAILFLAFCFKSFTQAPICIVGDTEYRPEFGNSRTVGDKKYLRINYHFILTSTGTGNFTETSDGDGVNYSGFDLAKDVTKRMNDQTAWNATMNIPSGNLIIPPDKNYAFVTDAVYFHTDTDNSRYFFGNQSNLGALHTSYGVDKSNVLNIYFTYIPAFQNLTGYVYDDGLFPTNKTYKATENGGIWQQNLHNKSVNYPISILVNAVGGQVTHELGHLLGLKHTVLYPWGKPCPCGCPGNPLTVPGAGPIDLACDDGCADTPTAWEIMAANNCTQHPQCGYGQAQLTDCSSNVMDYTNGNSLSNCQVGIIHNSIETQGGMKTYTTCDAVSTDRTYCDIGYPRVTYFGKNVVIGNCTGTLANVTSKEKLAVQYSTSVELNNFEVSSDAEFEVVLQGICAF